MRATQRIVPVALGAVALLAPTAGGASARTVTEAAPCTQWNVTGTWSTSQANNFHVTFRFKQVGTKLSGTAILPAGEAASLGYSTGKFTGTVKGKRLSLILPWVNGPKAEYIATVSSGAMTGSGRAVASPPYPWTAWWGKGPTRCVHRG